MSQRNAARTRETIRETLVRGRVSMMSVPRIPIDRQGTNHVQDNNRTGKSVSR